MSKDFLKRTALNMTLSVTLGATLALAGCGDSAEMRLQRAKIALSSGKPDQALQMADSVLAEKPGDPQALQYKAGAQMQLMQLDESHKTLQQLLKQSPDLADAHRLMTTWTF